MAKATIAPGQVIETTTPAELVHHLDRYTENWFQEKARGVTGWRFSAHDGVSAGSLQIPGNGEPAIAPNNGFVVAVQAMRIKGLATGDSVLIYRNSVYDGNFVGTMTAAVPYISFGSKGLILYGDEKIIVTGSSLMATGDITINGEGIEVPQPDYYKLV